LAGPKGMKPDVVKTLHDAFKKALEDPEHVAALDRFDQQIDYLGTEDYTAAAQRLVGEEAEAMKSLGLAAMPR
jgi:tripartite-type tricarboxylate transporter receptor subunit TctC